MPAFLLEIDGVERECSFEPAPMSVEHNVNGWDVLTCEVQDDTGTYRPPLGGIARVERTDVSPATTYFEGLIESTEERAWTDWGVPTKIRLTAFSYGVFASWVTATVTFEVGSPAQTLSDVLQQIVTDYLADYGVTLHPSQAAGEMLPVLAYDGATIADILRDLSARTGWVWTIDDQKRLWMRDPAAQAASFNVTGTNGKYVHDIKADTFRQKFANRVKVFGGQPGYYNQNISGETKTATAGQTKFLLDFPMFYFGTVVLTVTRSGTPTTELVDGVEWIFDRTDYSINKGTAAAMGAGDTILVGVTGYSAMWAMELQSDGRGSPSVPPRDLVIRREDLYDRVSIQALADAALAASNVDLQRVEYDSDDIDIYPGQFQTITLSERNLSGIFVVTEARTFYVSGGAPDAFRKKIVAVNEAHARAIWMDLFGKWFGQSRASTTINNLSAAGASPTTTTAVTTTATTIINGSAAGLDKYVQFNDAGRFGAVREFTWDKTFSELRVSASGSPFSAVALSGFGADYSQVLLGAITSSLGLTPADTSAALAYFGADQGGSGAPVFVFASCYRGLTPDTDQALPGFSTEFQIGGLVNGTYHDGVAVLEKAGATGAVPGCVLQITRNASGGGAPGCLALQSKDGTIYYYWPTNAGVLRFATAPPEEDGTPADSSGTAV